jgi:hypothetical protein
MYEKSSWYTFGRKFGELQSQPVYGDEEPVSGTHS